MSAHQAVLNHCESQEGLRKHILKNCSPLGHPLFQAQRRNISDWKKLSEDLKAKNAAEVVKERVDDEMEMSDDDHDENGDQSGKAQPPPPKK